jgi:hypothetical protein
MSATTTSRTCSQPKLSNSFSTSRSRERLLLVLKGATSEEGNHLRPRFPAAPWPYDGRGNADVEHKRQRGRRPNRERDAAGIRREEPEGGSAKVRTLSRAEEPPDHQGEKKLVAVLKGDGMTVLEQAEQLRQQAIGLLVAERDAIDEKLAVLGFDGLVKAAEPARKPKTCKICGQSGHTAPTCPLRDNPPAIPA